MNAGGGEVPAAAHGRELAQLGSRQGTQQHGEHVVREVGKESLHDPGFKRTRRRQRGSCQHVRVRSWQGRVRDLTRTQHIPHKTLFVHGR
eukprot:5293548-Prymnesium_polylepis.2